MKQVYLRFYGKLNDFLAPARKQMSFAYPFDVSPSVKDVIESVGVPHSEVELILAKGEWYVKLSGGKEILVRSVLVADEIRKVRTASGRRPTVPELFAVGEEPREGTCRNL